MYEEYEMTFFLVMLTNKLQRLKNLTKKEGEANFESINDTLKDIAGYAILGLLGRENHEENI